VEKRKKFFLLSLQNQTEDYYRLLKEYGEFFSKLIFKINKLKIFTIKPLVQFALFPAEIFSEKTEVPFTLATGCVRSTNNKISNVLCYKYAPNKKIPSFKSMTPDQKRGNIHELLHLFFSQQTNKSGESKEVRSLNKGFCEFVPRILFDLQKDIFSSTNFLSSIKEKEIVPLGEIDKRGIAYFLQKKLIKIGLMPRFYWSNVACEKIRWKRRRSLFERS
jgi:hypothetical protein